MKTHAGSALLIVLGAAGLVMIFTHGNTGLAGVAWTCVYTLVAGCGFIGGAILLRLMLAHAHEPHWRINAHILANGLIFLGVGGILAIGMTFQLPMSKDPLAQAVIGGALAYGQSFHELGPGGWTWIFTIAVVAFFLPALVLRRIAMRGDAEPLLPTYWGYYLCLSILGGVYVLLIIAMVVADLFFTSTDHMLAALGNPRIRYAINLSLISCTITTILSLWVAVPMGYLLARKQFWGKTLIDTILDVPIVLPPLVIGLSLLILFQTWPAKLFQDNFFRVTFQVPSVILAQFSVSTAFAVRTMRVTFEQISPRTEQVAMTLGCTPAQAFWRVVLPEARRGLLTAATLSWARALGEFGPILIFSGATHFRTEVLSTTVWLEFSVGDLGAGLAVSLLMIAAAVVVLILTRTLGLRGTGLV